jgi:hypothetical protein
MTNVRVVGWLSGGLAALVCACGGGTTPEAASAASGPKATELGRSAEQPVVTCGPEQSYAYVASRFQCPSGTNPLGGDVDRGRSARRGAIPSPHNAHILDVYDVPCSSGNVAVYVDMYGCPEYEEMLRESEQGSPAANELKANFQAGDFAGVVTHCRGLGVGAANDEGTWCRVLVPAALYAQLRKSDSLAAVTEACSGLHEATAHSDARAQYLAMTTSAFAVLTSAGKLQLTDEQREALVQSWLNACNVPAAQLQQLLGDSPTD